ncbi:acetyltransferase [bacterium]|nr:acetyltransferase [bacterium]
MQKIILWGNGDMTQILEYYINKDNAFEICAYTMDREYIKEKSFNSKPVIPFDEIEKHFSPQEYQLGIFMSAKKLNKIREEKYNQAKAKGYTCIKYISKNATCDATKVGENVFILPYTTVQPFCKIGNNVIIWPQAHIGHHTIVGDNCFFAIPKISGYCEIKNNCFLGTNCTLADHVKIGAYSIIGAGAVVTKNIKDKSVLAVKQTPKLEMSSFELEDLIQ